MGTNQAPYITSYGRIIQHTAISIWNNINKPFNHHTGHINIYTPTHFSGNINFLHISIQAIVINILFSIHGFYGTATLFWHVLCLVNL